jgi:adenylylsulfate kinase-like enzyme
MLSGNEISRVRKSPLYPRGAVCWITGLSGSGKTTLALALSEKLKQDGEDSIFLDGDDLRLILGISGSDFSRDERLNLAYVYARLCSYLANQGFIVIIATIALFSEIHTWNRKNLPNYCEVLLDLPIAELEKRDPKGIYARFHGGEISNVAGMDFEVDFPTKPDFLVTREDQASRELILAISNHLKDRRA